MSSTSHIASFAFHTTVGHFQDVICGNVSHQDCFQVLKPMNELVFSLFCMECHLLQKYDIDPQGSKEEAAAPTRSAVSSQENDSCNRCV